MSTYDLIRDAIVNKRLITATYDGYFREMCPHALGTKNGRERALFFQFAGESSKGPIQDPSSPKNWRCLFIDELSNVQVRDGAWHTGPNHTQAQTCVDNIDVEVTF